MLANLLVLELLGSVLDHMLLATNLKLFPELISIRDMVIREKLLGGAVLDPKLRVGLHWLTDQGGRWSIWGQDAPDSVVVAFGAKANFCVTRETCKDLWRQLTRVQIERLMEDVWIRNKSDLITVAHLVLAVWVINALYIQNRSSARPNILGGGRARVCLVN